MLTREKVFEVIEGREMHSRDMGTRSPRAWGTHAALLTTVNRLHRAPARCHLDPCAFPPPAPHPAQAALPARGPAAGVSRALSVV